ncbi:long-chain-fatty-acid--CoA ligase [Fulvitalea axinellae]|uniref:Long-chain-fatty-acid--CoA ligase n=1 Tax=Fulvitalea axinellae TaxID=1182444 RepID=A0AAU9CQH0_9BACT|nr:long-chain-fatty-acid--CoA ligase [Fulvitalea axinellae]
MSQDRPWYAAYPEGMAREIDVTEYVSLPDMVARSIRKFGDSEAFVNMGVSITFNDVDRLSRDFAAYLTTGLGLKRGDRFAIQMPNLLQYPIAVFGALRAGLVVVNTNPLYTPRELKHQLQDSGTKAILVVENFASVLQEVVADTDVEHVIVTGVGDLLGSIKGPVVNFAVKYVKKMVPKYSLPEAIPFKTTLKKGKSMSLEEPSLCRDDIALLQYTGGTTGVAKGAVLTQGNVIANMQQTLAYMSAGNLVENKEVMVTALPIYHIFSFTVNLMAMFSYGQKNVLITNPRDLDAFLKDMSKYAPTVLTGVNTLFNHMMSHPGFEKVNFSGLKVTVGGGMAVQEHVAIRWKEMTGCYLSEGYGLTEASPVVSCQPLNGNGKVGTIGLPFPSTDVKIVSDEGETLSTGEVGELLVKGPQVMREYWKRPDETKDVFSEDGWLKTGDMAKIDSEGYVTIVDRKKEMINVSGFNVYPNEVEDVVSSHPGVFEVGAIGVPNERSTEVVKIYVVKKDPSLTKEELRKYCKKQLTAYKVPKEVEFVDELPKSNVGKILRRKLKEMDAKSR